MFVDYLLKNYPYAAAFAAADGILKDRAGDPKNRKIMKTLSLGAIAKAPAHNPGFLMGRGKDHPKAVSAVTGGILTLFILANRKTLKNTSTLKGISANLIAAGAASNVKDRASHGYVVDYINLPVKKLSGVAFNLGDVMIASGCVMYILSEFME